MTLFTVMACLAYLAWLFREDRQARQNRARLRHVIHVNGIRGKSSVCRLIDAGLRAGGFRVLTKTTGTCPVMIGVNGEEAPLQRRGKPSIKEQLHILQSAVAQQAEILIVECMAILPEYQLVSERRMLRSDLGVITNVRHDHLEEMGSTLDEIAESLGNTLPQGGTLFLGEARFADFFAAKARACGSSLVLGAREDLGYEAIDFPENVSLALAVCAHLGVPRALALEAMQRYRRDPGAFRVEKTTNANGHVFTLLNALAANDPDSSARILERVKAQGLLEQGERILLINNRRDRPLRLTQFVDFAVAQAPQFDRIAIAGDCQPLMRRALARKGLPPGRLCSLRRIADLAAEDRDIVVFAVGNIVGSGTTRSDEARSNEEHHVG